MPESMDREAVAKWLGRIFIETRGATRSSKQATLAQADAVLSLLARSSLAGSEESHDTIRRLNSRTQLAEAALADALRQSPRKKKRWAAYYFHLGRGDLGGRGHDEPCPCDSSLAGERAKAIEECARVCDGIVRVNLCDHETPETISSDWRAGGVKGATMCAAAIRALGDGERAGPASGGIPANGLEPSAVRATVGTQGPDSATRQDSARSTHASACPTDAVPVRCPDCCGWSEAHFYCGGHMSDRGKRCPRAPASDEGRG